MDRGGRGGGLQRCAAGVDAGVLGEAKPAGGVGPCSEGAGVKRVSGFVTIGIDYWTCLAEIASLRSQ
jgi:hypothetical protein